MFKFFELPKLELSNFVQVCWFFSLINKLSVKFTSPKRPDVLQFHRSFSRESNYQGYHKVLGNSATFKLSQCIQFFFQTLADWKLFCQVSQCRNHQRCYNFSDLYAKIPLFSKFDLSYLRSGHSNWQTSTKFVIFFLLSNLSIKLTVPRLPVVLQCLRNFFKDSTFQECQ